MQWRNSHDRYGVIHQFFHWSMALAIIGMLGLGLYMSDLPLGMDKVKLYGIHKSIGILILCTVVLRLGWRLTSRIPPLPQHMKPHERMAAHISHLLLYTLMFAMPLSGWLYSSAAGFPVSVFGLFTMPDMVASDKNVRDILHEIHEYSAFLLIGLITVHISAALLHHFYYKDTILTRMVPFVRPDTKTFAKDET
jgi:cytochrome b561